MLINFRVKNFLSFKEEQFFSLVAKKTDSSLSAHMFDSLNNKIALLHASTIYGANAAGKSNLINALHRVTSLVLESTGNKRGDKIGVIPFLLCPSCKDEVSEFEIHFISNNVQYEYGISLTDSLIYDEWLYYYPNGVNKRILFERYLNDNGEKKLKPGPDLIKQPSQDRLYYQATFSRTNNEQLFLSKAAGEDNSQVLAPVYDWFKNHMIFDAEASIDLTCKKVVNGEKEEILNFLQAADLGIHDLNVQKVKFNQDKFLKDSQELPESLRNQIIKDLSERDLYSLRVIHLDSAGQPVEFKLDLESDGTKKMIGYAGFVLDAIKYGKTVIIDELHADLHPLLLEYVVGLFNNAKTGAQLIFTSHETNLLDPKKLRRDQIWFVSKNNKQESELYSFTDFKPRADERENWEKRYLKGFYGGVPYVKELNLTSERG